MTFQRYLESTNIPKEFNKNADIFLRKRVSVYNGCHTKLKAITRRGRRRRRKGRKEENKAGKAYIIFPLSFPTTFFLSPPLSPFQNINS